ncbi:uncharacterized protein ACO6RY_01384 [Pungitius sinensis]
MSEFPCKSVPSTNETPIKELKDSRDLLNGVKRAVVVLTRLPEYKINALRPPTPQQFYSEDDSLSSSDSDMQWEPEDDSSGSENSLSIHKKKTGQHVAAPNTSRTNTTTNNNIKITNVSEPAPVVISSVASAATAIRPNLPEEELKVDMVVLARKQTMRWQRGKILDLVTRADGRTKYKVGFDEKGKSLVSGHHVAFDTTPKLNQLYVGARVVVKCQDKMFRFRPGILAELPSRKNRLRFLVFLDCHLPFYVGLPSIHLVCRPLENVLDDIPCGPHKSFVTRYLKDWPSPLLTQYKQGESLNVELNGAHQRCEVQSVDGSLMQILFQDNQHTEWIHRGSMRLETMARFLQIERAPK